MDGAVAALRNEQILVTQISQVKKPASRRTRSSGQAVTTRTLAAFAHQLAALHDSGVPLLRSVQILRDAARDKRLARVLAAVQTDIESGSSLTAAMEKHRTTFDLMFTRMVSAGEAGGILDVIIKRLALYLDTTLKFRHLVRSAFIYAIAAAVLAGASAVVILWTLGSIFAPYLAGSGATSPPAIQSAAAFGLAVVRLTPFMVLAAGMAALALWVYYRSTVGRRKIDALALRLPVVGPWVLNVAVARACRSLGTLLAAGVPVLEALEIAAGTARNDVVFQALVTARRGVEGGESLATPLRETAVFPPVVLELIHAGESSGALDAALLRIADLYEREADVAMTQILNALTLMMLLALGAVAGRVLTSL